IGYQLFHTLQGFAEAGKRVRVLFQEVENFGAVADARVQLRIASSGVGAQLDEILRIVIERQGFAYFLDGGNLLRRGNTGGQPAKRIADIDGGIVSGGAEFAGENEVAVQNAAHGVADGLVEIVTFYQDRKEPGN